MALMLTPEIEHRLEVRLREGRWKTASEVLETALDLLDDMDDLIVVSREELNAKLEESFAAAERGETISGKDLEAELDVWRANLGA
jgi:Arc/MetJ-type ribon-helix-helix transcriptional regulator